MVFYYYYLHYISILETCQWGSELTSNCKLNLPNTYDNLRLSVYCMKSGIM